MNRLKSTFQSWRRWRQNRNEGGRLPRSRPLPRPEELSNENKALRDAIGPRGPHPWFGKRSTWRVYDIVTEAADRYDDSFRKEPGSKSEEEAD